MKTLTLIVLGLGIFLLVFRRCFDISLEKERVLFEKITQLFMKHFLFVRLTYVGSALFWLYLNQNNISLSQWDAHRIGIPVFWYTSVPALILLLYAIFPSTAVWFFIAAALVAGWGMHIQKTLSFCLAHMNVKTDLIGTILLMSFYLFVLVLCIVVLYICGPYAKRISLKQNNIAGSNNRLHRIADKSGSR